VLGAEGSYRWDLLASQRYAEVRGTPTHRGAFFRKGGEVFVVVGLFDSPLLVLRHALPSERWIGNVPPPPDPRPFTVQGRLLSRADAQRYQDGFAKLEAMGEVKPEWMLVAQEAPGADLTPLLLASALGVFGALNAVLLWRGVRRRARLGR
jgi:hypothetical protein